MKRQANFEILRVIAMAMIVAMHFMQKGGTGKSPHRLFSRTTIKPPQKEHDLHPPTAYYSNYPYTAAFRSLLSP